MSGSLEEKKTLLAMARVFRTDIQDIQQRGAGYYSCSPFVNRFNKLLAKCRELFSNDQIVILDSFDDLEDTKSVDPSEKMKVAQRVIIELGQLIAFMESVIGQDSRGAGDQTMSTSSERDSNRITKKQGSD
jgi:hypothetical protein